MRTLAKLAGLLVAMASATAQAANSEGPVVFETQARVDIDASGHVTAVAPDAALPAAVGRAIERTVGAWSFRAPMQAGKSVGGVTFVQLEVCAAQVDGDFQLALGFGGNGPRRSGPGAPNPPVEAVIRESGAKLEVTFQVRANGTAVLEDARLLEGNPINARAFRSAAARWLRESTFEPEQIGGQPVATRISFPITYTFGPMTPQLTAERRKREAAQALDAQSALCQGALQQKAGDPRAVSLDSAFELLSSG